MDNLILHTIGADSEAAWELRVDGNGNDTMQWLTVHGASHLSKLVLRFPRCRIPPVVSLAVECRTVCFLLWCTPSRFGSIFLSTLFFFTWSYDSNAHTCSSRCVCIASLLWDGALPLRLFNDCSIWMQFSAKGMRFGYRCHRNAVTGVVMFLTSFFRECEASKVMRFSSNSVWTFFHYWYFFYFLQSVWTIVINSAVGLMQYAT